jgi:hypothetical protein
MSGEPCPNQIPVVLRTGIDIRTTTKTVLDLDPTTNYLVAKELIPSDTLFSVLRGTVIIRENSKQG